LKKRGATIVKNALANVVRGGATAAVAIVLPHFLTRSLDTDHFAAWAFILQIAAYAGYLDFGLQTAVARYLAQAVEAGDDRLRDRLVSTALGLLTVAGLLALVIIGAIVWQLPHLLRHIPVGLMGDMRGGILVLSVSTAALLPLSTFAGILIGLQRNEHSTLAIVGSRLLGAFAVILVVRHTQSLIWLALCIGGFNLLGGIAQAVVVRRLLPNMRLRLGNINRKIAVELARFCSVLTIFSIAMLLISGLDVMIVGYFNFSAVGFYSVAATLTAFFAGLNSAVFNALLSPIAILQVRNEYGEIRRIVINATRLNTYASLLLTSVIVVFGSPLLRLWVGREYATRALPILIVLMLGQTVRLIGSVCSWTLVAMGMQRFAIAPAGFEGFSNLALSLLGILWLGPIGVAWGTLAAAVLGLLCYIVYTIKRPEVLQLGRLEFVRECILRPVACFSPLLLCTAFAWGRAWPSGLWLVWTLSLVVSLLIARSKGQLLPEGLFQRVKLPRLGGDIPI
jgi:O-antigen/teichoic acid export membrane protein